MSSKTVSYALAEEGRKAQGRETGAIRNDLQPVEQWIGRLRKAHGKEVILRACYKPGRAGLGWRCDSSRLGWNAWWWRG